MDSSDPEQNRWFTEQVQPHEQALRAWLGARFPSISDVDDLVQESYARMIRARQRERIDNAKSYLFSTARNAALDLFRRHRNVVREPLDDNARLPVLNDERPDAAEALNSVDEFEILKRAIEALPGRCREVMTLQKMNGLSNGEIAGRREFGPHGECPARDRARPLPRLPAGARRFEGAKIMKADATLSGTPGGDPASIERDAAQWVLRRQRGLKPGEEEEMRSWLAENERHAEIFGEMLESHQLLDRLRGSEPIEKVRGTDGRRHAFRIISTALAAAAAIALAWAYWAGPRSAISFAESASTAVGGLRKIRLPDGSLVQLNTDSAIEVRYSPADRRVRLIRGGLLHRVKESSPPFSGGGGPGLRACRRNRVQREPFRSRRRGAGHRGQGPGGPGQGGR